VLGGRPLVAHNAKPLLAAWMEAAVTPPTIDDSAVAAYLLNPARATYRLDGVCMEVFGECPPELTSVAPADLPRAVGDRARWLHRFWEHARNDLQERGLVHIYEEIERRTFAWFWATVNRANGLVPDGWPTPGPSSIAAVGFALPVYALGVERGWCSRSDARALTLTTLRFFWNARQGPDQTGGL